MKILVVDDNLELLQGLTEVLLRLKVEVTSCDSPELVLHTIGRIKPDLILMDIMMPGLDGITLINEIRKEFPASSIAAMTGYDVLTLRKKALDAGALTVLQKPFPIDELKKLINRFTPDHQILCYGLQKNFQHDIHHLTTAERYKAIMTDSLPEVQEILEKEKIELLVWEATPFCRETVDAVLDILRSNYDIPIAILSRTKIREEFETRMKEAGISAVITPPFKAQTVIETFHQLLSVRK